MMKSVLVSDIEFLLFLWINLNRRVGGNLQDYHCDNDIALWSSFPRIFYGLGALSFLSDSA